MAELSAKSAFAALLRPVGSGDGVVAEDLDGIGIVSVQAHAGALDAVCAALGAVDGPKRVEANGRAAIGVGRGRWLVIEGDAVNSLAVDLEAAIGDQAAIDDQSHGFAALRLAGPRVRDVLAKGVNIDLHPDAFPVGAAATTAIAHIGVTLWRGDDVNGAPIFEVVLFRSMAASFVHWLEASAGEYGLTVAPAD